MSGTDGNGNVNANGNTNGNANGNANGNSQQQAPTTFFQFMNLPPEMVQAIISFVDPVDEALLAATCKDMVALSGMNWDDVWTNPKLAWSFLKRVELDANPRLVPCSDCLTLHLPQACLRSYAEPSADQTYKCRAVMAASAGEDAQSSRQRRIDHLQGRPQPAVYDPYVRNPLRSRERRAIYLQGLRPALYGLAKYRRLGMDTSFMTEADKEEEYDHPINILPTDYSLAGVLTIRVRNKVDVNDKGVWFRQTHVVPLKDWIRISTAGFNENDVRQDWMYKWLTCKCGENAPRFRIDIQDIQTADGSTFKDAVFKLRKGAWYEWNDRYRKWNGRDSSERMLPYAFPMNSGGSREPIVGPTVGCVHCITDMQATMRFNGDDGLELVLTSWMLLGRADSPEWIQESISRLVNDEEDNRLRFPIGQLAAMSGMTA